MSHRFCSLANTAWQARSLPAVRRFERALRHPGRAQDRLLRAFLRQARHTAWGRSARMHRVHDPSSFRERVALQTYADLQPWIECIAGGEPAVLTHDPVTRLIPTSGSSSAVKLIPYTTGLQRQFNAAIGPWIGDLFRQFPSLRRGPAYWSISPAVAAAPSSTGPVPVGFDQDTAYLGRLGRLLVHRVLAVPDGVRQHRDLDDWSFATLWWLLRCRSLRLVSVWHPSFWSLLLDRLAGWWQPLLRGLATGRCERITGETLHVAAPLPGHHVAELERLGPAEPDRLWPELAVISAWGDASAAGPCHRLAERWPAVHVQPKGLLSTEAFVSLPYRQTFPAAVSSHVIEWLGDDGRTCPLDHAEVGGEYEPLVTTAGGLCRYRTGDRVRITGRLHATPTLRFLGRGDHVSDLCGEKLTEAFVLGAIDQAIDAASLNPTFNLLTPSASQTPPGYTWWIGSGGLSPAEHRILQRTLEQCLLANPHYRWARGLGQLRPVCLSPAPAQAAATLLGRRASTAQLGAVKLGVLGSAADDQALRTGPTATPHQARTRSL